MTNLVQQIQREKYVVLHGQSHRFRIIKYVVIVAISYLIFLRKGLLATGLLLLLLVVLGIGLHFFLRYKTNGRTKTWGPVKPFKTPFD